MRPETEKRPTARFRAAAPPRLGPRPSSRRPGRGIGPAWRAASALLGLIWSALLPAVDLHEARSDGRPHISRDQNFGRRRVPNPSAISFLLPLLSRKERRHRFRPARGRRRRCRGCLAGARRSPSERAAVEVAVGGALPCSCGRDPLQRESSGNAALGFCRPRRSAARSSCAPPRPGSCARDGGRRAHWRRD